MKHRKPLAALLLLLLLLGSPLLPQQALAAETEPADGAEWDFAGRGLDGVIADFMETYGLNETNFAMGWYDTVTGESWYYNPDAFIIAGSLYKLPLNMIYADKLAAGEITETSIAGGWKVGSAMRASLVSSNNEAAQALRAGLHLDYRSYRVSLAQYSGLDPEELPDSYYKDNCISPRFMINTLKVLYEDAEKYAQVIDYMKQAMPKHYFRLTQGEYEIAHKYGSFDGAKNDCGIVYTPRPFLLTAFFFHTGRGEELLGEICRIMTAYSLSLGEAEPPVEETPEPEPTPEPTPEPEPEPEPTPEEDAAEAEPVPLSWALGLTLCGAAIGVGAALLLFGRGKARLIAAIALLALGLTGAVLLRPLRAWQRPVSTPAAAETPLPAEETPALAPTEEPEPTPEPTPEPARPGKTEWTLSFAGDCTIATPHEWQLKQSSINILYVIGENYDYPFANVRPYFADDDFTMVNCEGAFTDSTVPRYKEFRFKAAPAYAQVFPAGSIEAVTLANNHTLDYQEQGLNDTKQTLDELGVLWTDSTTPLITTLDGGLKLGVISFNAVEIDVRVGSVDTYMERIRPCYEQCVEAECDLIFAFMHWGWEYHKAPEVWMVDFAHRLVDMGCDMVLGSHSHILDPMEVYNGTTIFYSLANFCYGGHSNPSDKDTVIVRQKVLWDEENGFTLGETELVPCRISTDSHRNDFCPTPYEEGSADYNRVLQKLGVSP